MQNTRYGYPYTAYFCEENIWHLGKALLAKGFAAGDMKVLFLSNAIQQVPLFFQRIGQPEELIIWDYHVILCCQQQIFDFDTTLPFPCREDLYAGSFPDHRRLLPMYHIYIRSVPVIHYHRHFHSDRSHMLDSTGNPVCRFPNTPEIIPEKDAISLHCYIDMETDIPGTRIYHYREFCARAKDSLQSGE